MPADTSPGRSATTSKQLRVLVADDHKMVRDGIRLLVDGQPDMHVVGEAGSGTEAVKQARELKPDVIVMDLTMPEMNGLRATEVINAEAPQIKILVVTVHEDESYLRQLCSVRAAGYVLKRSAATEMLDAIRAVAQGAVHFDAALAGKALAAGPRRHLGPGSSLPGEARLSEREEEVLRGVAWGLSNKELADRLQVSVKTVETYKVRVAEKLSLRSRTEMVQYALRQGWLSETQPFTPASALQR
jgi:two-component system, NarL family, response regulator NreC